MHDILRCAMKSLSRKWMRTMLTVSSITVGVTMVVIVSIISNVGKQVLNTELDNLGMSGLSVSMAESGGDAILTENSLEVIRGLSGVETAMPLLIEYSTSVLRDVSSSTLVCGIDAGAKQVISLTLKHGRMLSPGDVKGGLPVCVVDETVAQAAYRRDNIVGKIITLQVGGMPEEFEIIGVTKAGSSLLQNIVEFIPGMVYVPYTTLQKMTGRDDFDQIAVRVSAGADVAGEEQRIVSALERTSGLKGFFRTDNLAMQKERLSGLMDIVTLILTAISGISLLVSGLGIMTIMLVSVNERTREIGIKKAIGASRSRILFEFLAEAVIISLLGSIVGILIGSAACAAGMSLMGISASWNIQGFFILIGFAVAVGGVFGVYPAIKAARMRPVEALRVE